MSKKLLISLAVICVLVLAFVGINLKKDNVIRIAAAGYPMDEIVKIATEDLKKEGYRILSLAYTEDSTNIPTNTDIKRFFVNLRMIPFNPSPATFCNPSPINCIPYKNKLSPAIAPRIICVYIKL